jgi:hypothetical protein
MSMALDKDKSKSTETLVSALEVLFLVPEATTNNASQAIVHGIQSIVDELQKRVDVDEARLIRIEFHYISF